MPLFFLSSHKDLSDTNWSDDCSSIQSFATCRLSDRGCTTTKKGLQFPGIFMLMLHRLFSCYIDYSMLHRLFYSSHLLCQYVIPLVSSKRQISWGQFATLQGIISTIQTRCDTWQRAAGWGGGGSRESAACRPYFSEQEFHSEIAVPCRPASKMSWSRVTNGRAWRSPLVPAEGSVVQQSLSHKTSLRWTGFAHKSWF